MATTRMTNQRIKILNYLKGVKSHPTAETVYNAVRKDLPAISLATVYRNLNLLAEQGEIIRLEIGGEYRFDGDMCGHQHFICTKCRKVFDVSGRETSDLAMKSLRKKGFAPSCMTVLFRGKCTSCA
jgi:Fe2+ or Zn2+ uptake regulation protein